MINNLVIEQAARLIEEEPYDLVWMSYRIVGDKKRLRGSVKRGEMVQIKKPALTRLDKVQKNIEEEKYDEMVGFSLAVLLFYGDVAFKNMKFIPSKGSNINACVTKYDSCPLKHKKTIEKICHSDIDFVEYLTNIHKTKILDFDLESALKVYKLQGNKAIFGILCQIFYKNDDIETIYPGLIPNIPIKYDVDISNYVSGCNFPVAVSPKVTEFKCEENLNGWYLYAKYKEKWHVLDVFGVGHNQLFNHQLGNRLNFLNGGGQPLPFVICHNWNELAEAVRQFGGNGLIRDLRNDLFSHYWFNFGLDSLINVSFSSVYINRGSVFELEARNLRTRATDDKTNYLITNLRMELVGECERGDIVFSAEEIHDFFEIAEKIK